MEYALKTSNNTYESIEFKSNVIQTIGISSINVLVKINNNEFTFFQKIKPSNVLTTNQLPFTVTMKLSSSHPFSYDYPGLIPKYHNKKKIEDYLYSIDYGKIDYNYAYEHFKPAFKGSCSSVRLGNLFGRNFDWLYDTFVQFIVNTPASPNTFQVTGVAALIPGITQDTVDQDFIIVEGVDMFKLLPFYLVDGMNEKGLFITHNVVPLDSESEPTTVIPAKIEELDSVCIPMIPRFVLDRFSSAKQAIDYLTNYTTLFFSDEMLESGFQSHFLIGDRSSTYVLEFIDNEIKVIPFNFITNFTIFDIKLNKNNTIIYPPTTSGIQPLGSGLERWDMIATTKHDTLESMRNLLSDLNYSNMIIEPFRYSELVSKEDDEGNPITVDTDPSICTTAKNQAIEDYANKSRIDPKVTITCHSCIYDLNRKKLYIKNQESNVEYEFNM